MADDRGVHVEAAVAAQPQAEAEIDVLEIAEVLLVEAADLVERGAPVQRGGGAGGEDLASAAGQLAPARAMAVAPGTAGDVIAVAGAVEIRRAPTPTASGSRTPRPPAHVRPRSPAPRAIPARRTHPD